MSSCVMKMSKVALALAILFSVSSDNGSLCEALLLSKKSAAMIRGNENEPILCADKNGKLKNCDEFVSKGHIYRLKKGTKGRTAFLNSDCVKNKVPGFADGVQAALKELRKSYGNRKLASISHPLMGNFTPILQILQPTLGIVSGTGKKFNVFIGQKMFKHVTKAVHDASKDRTDKEALLIQATNDIKNIAYGIDRDLLAFEHNKKEAITACISDAKSAEFYAGECHVRRHKGWKYHRRSNHAIEKIEEARIL